MNDKELIQRWDDYVESMGSVMGDVEHMAQQMRNRVEVLIGLVEKAYDEGFTDGFSSSTKNPAGDFRCSLAFAALNTETADK